MPTRAATEATLGTCDWGHCDDVTIAERQSPSSGEWLAVCARHVGSERRPAPGRAVCAYCGGEYTLRVDGTFRLHNRGFVERCLGSMTTPERTS